MGQVNILFIVTRNSGEKSIPALVLSSVTNDIVSSHNILAVKWLFEIGDKKRTCSQNSIFVQKFFVSFLKAKLQFHQIVSAGVCKAVRTKAISRQKKTGPETWPLDSSQTAFSVLFPLPLSICLSAALCKVLGSTARPRQGSEMSPWSSRRDFVLLERNTEPGALGLPAPWGEILQTCGPCRVLFIFLVSI